MKQINNVSEIQDVLFDSLCYLKSICDKYGLKYYLTNGTLLGAVKYGEFIPWDDDADVFMPREDYDKLCSIDEINSGNYKLLSKTKFPSFRCPYAKLIDTRTVLEECGADFGTEVGIFVDIFPIDKWSPNFKKAKIEAGHCEILKRMLISANQPKFNTKKTGIKRFILFLIWKMGHMQGHQKLLHKILNQAVKYNDSDSPYCGCVVWAARSEKEILPTSVFEKDLQIKLRDVCFTIPSGYDGYLSSLYGDWRSELPKEQQHSNHDFKIWWKE